MNWKWGLRSNRRAIRESRAKALKALFSNERARNDLHELRPRIAIVIDSAMTHGIDTSDVRDEYVTSILRLFDDYLIDKPPGLKD